jgi:hypothetical protein
MRTIATFTLILLTGCEGLFSGFQRNHPMNCVADPLVCGPTERCNPVSEICEPADPTDPDLIMKLAASRAPAGDGPFALALADLDQDGKLDVAVACNGSNNNKPGAEVLLGDGRGGLSAPSHNAAGSDPVSLVAAELGQDQSLDLGVVSLDDMGRGSLRVLAGTGGGRFTSCLNSGSTRQDGPHAIATGDWNGDGRLDLAVANSADDSVSVLLNTGGCRFNELPRIAVDPFPWALAVGDLDGDQRLDILVASRNRGTVTELRGMGGGIFGKSRTYATGMSPSSLALGDV